MVAVSNGFQEQLIALSCYIFKWRKRVGVRGMAILTADRILFAGHFPGVVTVKAGKAALFVDVRGQLMQFHTIGTGKRFSGGVRGPVFPIVIVFIPAKLIRAYMIGVMAA